MTGGFHFPKKVCEGLYSGGALTVLRVKQGHRTLPLVSTCVLQVSNCSCSSPVGGDVAVWAARVAAIIHLVPVGSE